MGIPSANITLCDPLLCTSRYKAAGTNVVDEAGTKDTTEFLNIAKDDVLAFPQKIRRDYPEPVNTHMLSVVKPFVLKSIDICATVLSILNDRLGLTEDKLASLHRFEKPSGCQSRCIRCPPGGGGVGVPVDSKLALSAHTDFGSLVSSYD